MVIEQCRICLAEYDPRVAVHPPGGAACVTGLKFLVEELRAKIERFQSLYQDFAAGAAQKDDAIVNSFSEMKQHVDAQNSRIDLLAKRVNLLEHPNLKKVPSMPKGG